MPTGTFPTEIPCTGPEATPWWEAKTLCHHGDDDTLTQSLTQTPGQGQGAAAASHWREQGVS